MVDRRITELVELTEPVGTDWMEVVDNSEALSSDKNKKITIDNILKLATVAILADTLIAAPADGQVLTYETSSGKWKNQAPANPSPFPLLSDTIIANDSVLAKYGTDGDSSIYDDGANMFFDADVLGAGSRNFKFLNGSISLPTGGSPTTKALIFDAENNNGSGFYSASGQGVKAFYRGVESYTLIASASFAIQSKTNNGGFAFKNQAGSLTIPSITFLGRTNNGISTPAVDQMAMIAGSFPNILITNPASIVSGSQDGNIFDVDDLTITGNSTSFFEHKFMAADVNGAFTIDNAATVYISGAPAGTSTITNPYALWVDAGNARFDDDITVSGRVRVAIGTLAAPSLSISTLTGTGVNFLGTSIDVNIRSNAMVHFSDSGSDNVVFNQDGDAFNFRVETNADTHGLFVDGGVNAMGVGVSSPLAKLDIDQNSATGAKPVLKLKQTDISEEMIELDGTTIGTGNAIESIGAKTLTTTHFIKVTITGVGTRYMPVGTIA